MLRILRQRSSPVLLTGLFVFLGLGLTGSGRVPVPGAASYTTSSDLLLTASVANYWPSSSGVQVDLYDSLSLQWRVVEATGADPSVDVAIEQSNDGTNWAVPYNANTAVANLNGGAPWTTETTWRLDKLLTVPGKYLRIRITEGAADADVTFSGVLYAQ
jgi:hypothetical protein